MAIPKRTLRAKQPPIIPPPDEDDTAPYVKRGKLPRQKRFGIQWYSQFSKRWHNRGWYLTRKQRDQALADLKKHAKNFYMQVGKPFWDPEHYRPVDR